jgi:hypothetical protein
MPYADPEKQRQAQAESKRRSRWAARKAPPDEPSDESVITNASQEAALAAAEADVAALAAESAALPDRISAAGRAGDATAVAELRTRQEFTLPALLQAARERVLTARLAIHDAARVAVVAAEEAAEAERLRTNDRVAALQLDLIDARRAAGQAAGQHDYARELVERHDRQRLLLSRELARLHGEPDPCPWLAEDGRLIGRPGVGPAPRPQGFQAHGTSAVIPAHEIRMPPTAAPPPLSPRIIR